MKATLSRHRAGLIAGAMLLAAAPLTANAAGERYLSALATAAGENAEEALIDKGCTVLHPMLYGNDGEGFWIGCQKTADSAAAVTELRTEADGSFTWATGGEKTPVVSLYFLSAEVTGSGDFDQVMPLPNNGAAAMPDQNGDPAVFRSENGQGYLAVIREDVWKPYIDSVTFAAADSKKDAVTRLYKDGCEYYIDQNLSDDGAGAVYLGYTRTADAQKALTDMVALNASAELPAGYEQAGAFAGRTLCVTRDARVGNPIVDLEPLESGKDAVLDAKEAAVMITAKGDDRITQPYILDSEGYQTFVQSDSRYLMSDITREDGSPTGLSFVSAQDGVADKQREKQRLLGIAPPNAASSAEDDADAPREPEAAAPKNEEEGAGEDSSVNSGAGTAYADAGGVDLPLPAILIPLFFVVAIPIATIIIRKRILKKRGEGHEKS